MTSNVESHLPRLNTATLLADAVFEQETFAASLFDALREEDVHRAYAGVALPNEASLALHRRFGFTEIGTFREVGRKFGRWWDVTWLEKPLG